MNNVLEYNEYNDAPPTETIDDAETRKAVHAEFEELVAEIDEAVPAETKEQLKTVVDRKCEGDVQNGGKARY